MSYPSARPLVFLLPCYNDWESIGQLLARIHEQARQLQVPAQIVVVNDGSLQAQPDDQQGQYCLLNLNRNVGHQKALAVGLSYIAEHMPGHDVLVMDADGEDKPEHLPDMLKVLAQHPDAIIVAQRRRRREGLAFQVFYVLYKRLVHLLTGFDMGFGNFCYLPAPALMRLTHMHELWNHLAATVLRSKWPLVRLPLDKGPRIAGRSHMNFTTLVKHGMAAVSVHLDILSVRMLILSAWMVGFIMLASCIILYIKLFTPHATPGWATTLMVGAGISLSQFLLSALMIVLLVLNNQMSHREPPSRLYSQLIQDES